jgi:hypothetical protein
MTASSLIPPLHLAPSPTISHRERRITVHVRDGETWSARVAISGGRVGLPSLATDITVDEVYRNSGIAG